MNYAEFFHKRNLAPQINQLIRFKDHFSQNLARLVGIGLLCELKGFETVNEMTLKIGTTLRTLIKERRMTLVEISKATGVPATTIAEWSNNRAPKNPVHAQKVASHLGVSLHFLLFGEEDHQEPITKLLKEDLFSGTFEINIKRIRNKVVIE